MPVRVAIPTHLSQYTHAREVQAEGERLAEVVLDLDRRYPGLRFRIIDEQDRIRPHIKLFVGEEMAKDLGAEVPAGALVTITAALSGG